MSFSSLRGSNDYGELNEIGSGAYGVIYKGQDIINTENRVVMKKINVSGTNVGLPTDMLQKVALLRGMDELQHPNVIRFLDVMNCPNLSDNKQVSLYLVFEYIEQDLMSYMTKHAKSGISSDIIKNIMRQILSGIDFLHSNRVVHGDLKPENVLMTSDFQIKIANFNLAKISDVNPKMPSAVEPSTYRAPEWLLGLAYGNAVDIWSCGCIMGEMYVSTPLFGGESAAEQLDNIFRVIGTPPALNWPKNAALPRSSFEFYPITGLKNLIPNICPKLEDLMMKMFMFDAVERVPAIEALKHPYFD